MIERAIPHSAVEKLLENEIAYIVFVDIDWPGGRVRAHTGIGDRPFAGETYIGVGEFGGVGQVSEATDMSPNQLSLSLRVLDSNLVSTILNESPEGREVVLHIGVLDENRVIVEEIPYVFDGDVAGFDLIKGDVDKQIPYQINLRCSDWLERWAKPPDNARTTNNAQQHMYPGDRFFDLTEIISSSPLNRLPTRRSRGSTRGRAGAGGRTSDRNEIAAR